MPTFFASITRTSVQARDQIVTYPFYFSYGQNGKELIHCFGMLFLKPGQEQFLSGRLSARSNYSQPIGVARKRTLPILRSLIFLHIDPPKFFNLFF
jgi:hypothetical protein